MYVKALKKTAKGCIFLKLARKKYENLIKNELIYKCYLNIFPKFPKTSIFKNKRISTSEVNRVLC